MAYRTRIKYTFAQKQEIWGRWKKGESLNSIGRLFDRPPIRKRSKRVLPSQNENKFQEARLLIYPFAQSLNI